MERSALPHIEGYRLLGIAGRGQFGRVLCAYQNSTGTLVALKELDKYRFPTHKLLRELRFLIDLQHPNVVHCETILFAEGYRYLVMEYCEAGTLRDVLSNCDQLSVAERLGLAIAVLRGLAHAHQKGIVHCDIKPENILLKLENKRRVVKVSDFGIAHLFQEVKPNSSYRTGSPAYMAPERFYGQFLPSSDLYAVGIILYELFLQERPFQGTAEELMTAHLNQRPALGKLPLPLQEVVSKALAKLPSQRFESADEMADTLDRLLATNAVPLKAMPISLAPVQAQPEALPKQVSAIVKLEEQLLLGSGQRLVARNGQVHGEFPQPIASLQVQGDWLYIQTNGALYRSGVGSLPQLIYQVEGSATKPAFCYCASPDWVAVGKGTTLSILSLKHGKSRSLEFPNRLILALVMLDVGHFALLTQKEMETDQLRLIFLNRRGLVLGKLPLPATVQTIVPSLTPYRLLILETAPGVLLMDLCPYRVMPIPLPFVPQSAIATIWGYGIASANVLMLIDLMGQSLANLQFPHPITQVIAVADCQLVVLAHDREKAIYYGVDLQKEGVELII